MDEPVERPGYPIASTFGVALGPGQRISSKSVIFSDVASVNRLLRPLVATTLVLGVLFVWQRTYEQPCKAAV
ncbi:MAG: hypothetical protein F4X07_05720 [Acidimicrobiaceae bacterium]|nr:hypothetical protein [Acidimicrobiaceae bacterium]